MALVITLSYLSEIPVFEKRFISPVQVKNEQVVAGAHCANTNGAEKNEEYIFSKITLLHLNICCSNGEPVANVTLWGVEVGCSVIVLPGGEVRDQKQLRSKVVILSWKASK